jgi:serine/threonine-protein kinase
VHRLITLGALDLRNPAGDSMRELLAQPKRMALLVYLSISSERGPVPRAEVMALLWPESDEAHARNALSQVLYHVRHSLSAEAFPQAAGDVVSVNDAALWCDAVTFLRAVSSQDDEAALELYRGDFCPALFVSGAPEFDRWVDGTRARLRRAAWASGRRLAERRVLAGDNPGAAAAARTTLALEPEDEETVRALLGVLERAGDRAGALHAYQAYARRLARDLQTTPSPETRELAMRMRAGAASATGAEFRGGADARVLEVPPTSFGPGAASGAAAGSRIADTTPRRRRKLVPYVVLTIVATALAGVAAIGLLRAAESGRHVDERLMVVAPFRMAVADSSLLFLREGMVDLLSAALRAGTGLRPADPRASLAAWRHAPGGVETSESEAILAARRLGAGRLLIGSVVGRADRLVISATLVDTRRSEVRARPAASGPLDSLPEVIDRLAAQTLLAESGEPPQRLRDIISASLPAVRAYLLGRSAYRRGRYGEAAAQLRLATELDTAFAVAALEYAQAADWLTDGSADEAGRRAWALRARLGPPDRTFLVAWLGPRYPGNSPFVERVTAWERATRVAPDRPEAWYELGDELFHYGDLVERDSGFARARAALSRAVELDSAYTAPLAHLVQIAVRLGDTEETRRLTSLYFARDTTGEVAAFLRWRVAVARGDSATVRAVESRLEGLPAGALRRIAAFAQLDGIRVDVGLRCAELLAQRAATPAERDYADRLLAATYGNLGRFGARHRLLDRMLAAARARPGAAVGARLADALFWDGDTVAGHRARLELEGLAAMSRPDYATEVRAILALTRFLESSTVDRLQWEALATRMAESVRDQTWALHWSVADAVIRALPNRGLLLHSFDSAAVASSGVTDLNMYSSKWHERAGDLEAALRAARRRAYLDLPGLEYLAGMLRVEGRLAAMTGDTSGAIRAYRHYLALRFDPDPALGSQVETVRRELARLQQRGAMTTRE